MDNSGVNKLTTKSYLKLFDSDQIDDLLHTLLKTNPKLFVVISSQLVNNGISFELTVIGCYILF